MSYRIAGHESFPCRYTWLPKAVQGLTRNSKLFADDAKAMVDLGVGKNMVRSIRFWSQVAGIASAGSKGAGHMLTEIGEAVLGSHGRDRFLEDIRTLWLLHWNLSTNVPPLLAWDFLLNRWQESQFTRTKVLKALHEEAARLEDDISIVTVEQHFDTFLHTYVPTRGHKGEVQEDNLDCPLVELELLVQGGDREPVYEFRREEKPDVTAELFAYCLNDYWEKQHAKEETVAFRDIAHGHGSPGQIFKIPEQDIRTRLEGLAKITDDFLVYVESANIPHVRKHGQRDRVKLLKQIYRVEAGHG